MPGLQREDEPTEARDAGRPLSVLIVDDDADTRASLRALLEDDRPPFLVLTAASGREGLDLLAGAPVDLAIADYRMEPMDGLAFLVAARQLVPRVKRFMMTAYPEMKLAIEAVNKGRVEHLFLKPVDPGELLRVLRGLRAERDADAERARGYTRRLDELRRRSGPR